MSNSLVILGCYNAVKQRILIELSTTQQNTKFHSTRKPPSTYTNEIFRFPPTEKWPISIEKHKKGSQFLNIGNFRRPSANLTLPQPPIVSLEYLKALGVSERVE